MAGGEEPLHCRVYRMHVRRLCLFEIYIFQHSFKYGSKWNGAPDFALSEPCLAGYAGQLFALD